MPERLRFLAVHAHPDDETICTGGTFARYAAEGIQTALVCCTRGEEGEIHDPTIDAAHARARLGSIREAELRAAADALGIAALYLLPYRDSGMAGVEANDDPRSFVRADPAQAAERLAAILRRVRPHVVVAYDPAGGYGHPDHRMAHRVTLLASEAAARAGRESNAAQQGWQVAKLYYTVFSLDALRRVNERMQARGLAAPFRLDTHASDIRQSVVPEEDVTTRVDVGAYREQVRRALRAHRTQIAADDVLLTLPQDIAAEAFGVERYVRAFTRVPAPAQETDLFAGLR